LVEFDIRQHLSLGDYTEYCVVSEQLRTHIWKPSVQQVKFFPHTWTLSWTK